MVTTLGNDEPQLDLDLRGRPAGSDTLPADPTDDHHRPTGSDALPAPAALTAVTPGSDTAEDVAPEDDARPTEPARRRRRRRTRTPAVTAASAAAAATPAPAARTADEALQALRDAASDLPGDHHDGLHDGLHDGHRARHTHDWVDTDQPAPSHHVRHERVHRRWPWLVAVSCAVLLVGGLLAWSGTRDREGSTTGVAAPGLAVPEDLDDVARVRTPGDADPGVEVDGEPVTYVGDNLLDGDPDTAWRIPGDAQGRAILFVFKHPVVIDRVGLVNGYAETVVDATGQRYDWYRGHRRITQVGWAFDDGTYVEQDLADEPRMQTIDVDSILTRTVTLWLKDVTDPGTGRASRDYTAISDVELAGDTDTPSRAPGSGPLADVNGVVLDP